MDTSYLVRTSGGSIDTDASVEKFREDLVRYQTATELEGEEIGAAVRAAFSEVAIGASLNMPYLQSKVLQSLNAQSANFKDLQTRTAQWVRDHAQGETITHEDGTKTVDRPDSEFVIAKGKNGGVNLRADRATRDELARQAEAAKK